MASHSLDKLSIVFLICVALCGPTLAKANSGCVTYKSPLLGKDVEYCVERSRPDLPAANGEPVAYFMHGTNGGARTWVKNNYSKTLAALRKTSTLKPMTFVSFDTEAYSFFVDHPLQGHSMAKAYETWFIQEFIPHIEKNLKVCAERKCRGVMGESMGGYGAIQTALRHPTLFSAIAVNSPALSPFAEDKSLGEWKDYFKKQHISRIKKIIVPRIFYGIFKDPAFFDAHNPDRLVEKYDEIERFPALYFDMGAHDEYGFYEGYAMFKAALDARGFLYSTQFDQNAHHDMWKTHADAVILFLQQHLID